MREIFIAVEEKRKISWSEVSNDKSSYEYWKWMFDNYNDAQ